MAMQRALILAAGLACAITAAHAQTATATCKDGTSWSGTQRSGACSRHGGVKAFAGAAKVWVNTPTKVYHCPSDPAYGKTKVGAYMTESAAKAAGDRPDSGKACS